MCVGVCIYVIGFPDEWIRGSGVTQGSELIHSGNPSPLGVVSSSLAVFPSAASSLLLNSFFAASVSPEVQTGSGTVAFLSPPVHLGEIIS